jgi:hypothetical protein
MASHCGQKSDSLSALSSDCQWLPVITTAISKVAAKEVGVIADDDPTEEPRHAGANCDLLFPI